MNEYPSILLLAEQLCKASDSLPESLQKEAEGLIKQAVDDLYLLRFLYVLKERGSCHVATLARELSLIIGEEDIPGGLSAKAIEDFFSKLEIQADDFDKPFIQLVAESPAFQEYEQILRGFARHHVPSILSKPLWQDRIDERGNNGPELI